MADSATTANTESESNENEEVVYKLSKHKAKFKVQTFALVSDEFEKPINLNPAAIKSILIMQDFDNCLQPILQLQIVLPPLILNYIKTHKSQMSFLFRLQQIDYIYAQENFMLDRDYNTNGTADICNDQFILFSAEDAPMPNLAEYKSVTETITGETNNNLLYSLVDAGSNMINYTNEYTLFLWKESDLYQLRANVNYVFNNVTLGDASASILSNSGFTNVLMAPTDNTETFGQLIVPPMTQMNVFNYFQTTYGMYNTDVLFFCDIYRTYVIDKSGECKAYEENEYKKTVLNIVKSNSVDSQDVGTSSIDLKGEFHNKVDIENVSIRSLSSLHDVIQGNSNLYIDSRNNEITTVSGASEQRGDGCVNITTDQEGTPYTKSKQANDISEMGLNLKVNTITDYNYFAFTPNKSFVIAFKDKEFYAYNGYYRLMKATHVLTREGQGVLMAIVGSFEFARKKALSEDEYNTIQYDVFRTAQVTEEGKQEAESKADENNQKDSSYQQSEENQVKEGKMDATPKENTGSAAPEAVGDSNTSSTSSSQPFNPSTDSGYQAQEASKNSNNSLNGSPAPTPLDEKNK